MELLDKVKSGQRISQEEALKIYDEGFYALAKGAVMRKEFFGLDKSAGYIVNRMINYSNICSARCKFCAYHAKAGTVAPFKLDDERILKIVEESVGMGALQIMLQGGLDPMFTLDWASGLLSKIRKKFPSLGLHAFSPSELVHFAHGAGVSIYEALRLLKESGLSSMPGAADLLIDEFREKYCAGKCTVAEWKEVMRSLANLGLRSSATMTFGMGETLQDRLKHLQVVRDVQDETKVFDAFIAWPLAPENTELAHIERTGSVEFLKTLALARIFLDNIKNIQSGWLTEGLKIAQIALQMGANDVGGILMDEMVVKAAGIENTASASDMERSISAAGFTPYLRDNFYNLV